MRKTLILISILALLGCNTSIEININSDKTAENEVQKSETTPQWELSYKNDSGLTYEIEEIELHAWLTETTVFDTQIQAFKLSEASKNSLPVAFHNSEYFLVLKNDKSKLTAEDLKSYSSSSKNSPVKIVITEAHIPSEGLPLLKLGQ